MSSKESDLHRKLDAAADAAKETREKTLPPPAFTEALDDLYEDEEVTDIIDLTLAFTEDQQKAAQAKMDASAARVAALLDKKD